MLSLDSTKKQSENALFFVSLKIILRNSDGSILLLKLPPTSAMAGYYDLPGGRIHKGEEKIPLSNTIARELKEEVGNIIFKLSETPVAVSRHFYISKKTGVEQNLFWVFFEAQYIDGEIKVSEEHTKYKWVRITKNNIGKFFIKGALEGMRSYLYKEFYPSVWSQN